jgi:hypothetical protein
MEQIEIHEFSTGISIEGKENNWFSTGFTGKYMNSTLEEIPAVVQRAISDREFAVAERGSTEQPTFIARELADKEGEWSVVAVITRAKDDFGRYLSVYRYFLVKGRNHIATILHWMNNKPLVFDPFDLKEIGQIHHYSYQENTTIPIDNFKELITEEIPLIIPHDQAYNTLVIDSIAQKKAGDKLVAWAYNVTDLEMPTSFYVIYPTSAESEENLRKIIINQPITDKIIIGEQGIKTAINGLISRDKVKLQHLQTLEEALANEDIDSKYWEKIFNGRGAKDALKENLYSSQMVRLLTLKAMFIPDSLSQFLTWMGKRQGKEQDHWDISLRFQNNVAQELRPIINNFPQLSSKIEKGIKFVLFWLLKEPESLYNVVKILENKRGIWRNFYYYGVRKYLDNELNLMSKFITLQQSNLTEELDRINFKLQTDQDWKNLFDDLSIFWQPNAGQYTLKKYQIWAELFKTLKDYKLAAFFCQISINQVPQSVFSKLCKFSWGTNFKITVYGIDVYREVGLAEQIILQSINTLKMIIAHLLDGLKFINVRKYKILLMFITLLVILNVFTVLMIGENIINISKIIIENLIND